MVDQDINFTLDFVDNITAAVSRIEGSVSRLDVKLNKLSKSTTEQNVKFLTQVTAVRSLDMGMRGLVNVGTELGLVSGNLAKSLRNASLAVHGLSSAFQLLKGANMIITQLKTTEIGLAVVESYRAVLRSPIKMAALTFGLSASAGVAGYLMGQSTVHNTNSTTNTVNFTPMGNQSDQRQTAMGVLDSLGGF